MKNKKGIELSINMLVVIILGIVILGAGFTAFYKTAHKVSDINDQVDAQTQQRLNSLLDDGAPIVILMNTKDGERGDSTTFSMAINNNLLSTKQFTVNISYAGTTADYEGNDPFNPSSEIGGADCSSEPDNCGNAWILIGKSEFSLENNGREHFPLRITVPKKEVKRGQYIFNVDVFYKEADSMDDLTRFSSRQKIYVTIS